MSLTRDQISSVMHYPNIAAAAVALGVSMVKLSAQHRKLFRTKWNISTPVLFTMCCKMWELSQLGYLKRDDAKLVKTMGSYFQAALRETIQDPAFVPDSDHKHKNNLHKARRIYAGHYLDLLAKGIRLTWDTLPKDHQFGFLEPVEVIESELPVEIAEPELPVEIAEPDLPIEMIEPDLLALIDASLEPDLLDFIDASLEPDLVDFIDVSVEPKEVVVSKPELRRTVYSTPAAMEFEEMDLSDDESDDDFALESPRKKTRALRIDDSDSSDDDFIPKPPRKKTRALRIDDSDDDAIPEPPRKKIKREQTSNSVCKYRVIEVEMDQFDRAQEWLAKARSERILKDADRFPDFTTMSS